METQFKDAAAIASANQESEEPLQFFPATPGTFFMSAQAIRSCDEASHPLSAIEDKDPEPAIFEDWRSFSNGEVARRSKPGDYCVNGLGRWVFPDLKR